MPTATKEQIADRITELLIEHFNVYDANYSLTLSYFQKVVRDGRIQVATIPQRTDDERLVLYRSDVKGNEADIELLNFIYNTYFAIDMGLDMSSIQLVINDSPIPDVYHDIVTLIVGTDIIEVNAGSLTETFYQDNLGQFVDFFETHSYIDVEKAKQILDTNIYELYPSELTKQQRINRLFTEYENLKPPSPITDDGYQALQNLGGEDGTDTYIPEFEQMFHDFLDISDSPIDDEENRYITWRERFEDHDNINKSLEYLYEDLQTNYFTQEDIEPDIVEERPKYRSRSSGYLKVRTLNQAIIVRNEESSDIGLVGPDENYPIWQDTGFTITMWVRFLDKVNGGTLFNFGNPLRENGAKGFMLETFVKEFVYGEASYPDEFFDTENVERFVRLVVRDEEGIVRDSHVGNVWSDGTPSNRIDTTPFNTQDDLDANVSPFNYTRIPIDLREWYFIVATYDPNITEDLTNAPGSTYLTDPDFWRWNMEANGDYTSYSGYGAKCKVEIISRTDLLRARGFQT